MAGTGLEARRHRVSVLLLVGSDGVVAVKERYACRPLFCVVGGVVGARSQVWEVGDQPRVWDGSSRWWEKLDRTARTLAEERRQSGRTSLGEFKLPFLNGKGGVSPSNSQLRG